MFVCACTNRLLVDSTRRKEAVASRELTSGEGLRCRVLIPTCTVCALYVQ
jgi:hypothetical protein